MVTSRCTPGKRVTLASSTSKVLSDDVFSAQHNFNARTIQPDESHS